MKKTMVILSILSRLCLAEESQKKLEFNPNGIEIIKMETETANLDISSSETSVIVEKTGKYDEQLCYFSALVEGETLKVTLKNKEAEKKWYYFWKRNKRCKGGLRVIAPKSKKLIVNSGVGDIKIDGFFTWAEIDAGVGDLKLRNLSGSLKIGSGVGSVKGEINCEKVSVESGVGSVNLRWNSFPQKGKVSVSSGTGDVRLSFPKIAKIAINHESGVGKFDSDFNNDPEAAFFVDIETGVGDQEIKKY